MKNITIDGHIGDTPKKKTTSTGIPFLQFSVGVNTLEKGINTVEWFGITDYNVNDEKRLRKGDYVLIQARDFKASVNAKDGKMYLNQNAIATQVNVLIKKKSEDAQQPSVYDGAAAKTTQPTLQQKAEVVATAFVAPSVDDDLPF